jgi:hypothetical protein
MTFEPFALHPLATAFLMCIHAIVACGSLVAARRISQGAAASARYSTTGVAPLYALGVTSSLLLVALLVWRFW